MFKRICSKKTWAEANLSNFKFTWKAVLIFKARGKQSLTKKDVLDIFWLK